jgi:membrane associated rhomboid family serine protease
VKLRITYNAPVVLTFTLLAVLVYAIPGSSEDFLNPNSFRSWFVAYPKLGEPFGARSYVGLFTHILGHAGWEHLLGNFMLILLIGPILEERHGSVPLLVMILITALVTGIANVLLSSHVLVGASGVVFMMILLASTANIRQGEIPLTFIAVALVYLGGELYRAFKADDGISHMAHLVGGLVGAGFGFLGARARGPKLQAAKVAGLPVAKATVKGKPIDAAAKLDKIKV